MAACEPPCRYNHPNRDSIVQNMTGAAMKLRAADKLFESNRAEAVSIALRKQLLKT